MAVAYDNTSGRDVGSSPLTGTAFTISGSNRAGVIGCVFIGSGQTITSSSLGGVSGTIISNTNTTTEDGTYQTVLIGVIAPATGSQSASVTWTGGAPLVMGAITFTGVDQSGVNSGSFTGGTRVVQAFGSGAITVSSAIGDMTTTVCEDGLKAVATDKTLRWSSGEQQGGDTAAGASSVTHTWSGTSNFVISGANVKAAGGDVSIGLSGSASTGGHGTQVPNFQIPL